MDMNKQLSFLLLYVFLGLVDLVCLSVCPDFRFLTKPLIMLLLIGYFFSEVKIKNQPLFFVGLVMAWLGDVFLLVDEPLFFMLGLSSFLIMQIIYSICFMKHEKKLSVKRFIPVAIVNVAAIFLVYVLWDHLGDMLIPVLIYTLSIVVMASFGLIRDTGLPGYGFVALGVILFVVSDSVLAYGKFIEKSLVTSLIVMTTYIGAQYLIVVGYIRYLKWSKVKEADNE